MNLLLTLAKIELAGEPASACKLAKARLLIHFEKRLKDIGNDHIVSVHSEVIEGFQKNA